jgi:hypothetical protein
MNETLITDLAWGQMEVTINGEVQHFKDCKLWPGGAREWRWEETGTHHKPGIQLADIGKVLTHDMDTKVISGGLWTWFGILFLLFFPHLLLLLLDWTTHDPLTSHPVGARLMGGLGWSRC